MGKITRFKINLKTSIIFDIIIMSKKEKRILKLLNSQSALSYNLVKHVLNDHGYYLDKINGSHFYFKKNPDETLTIPVHNKKIKNGYRKYILNSLQI